MRGDVFGMQGEKYEALMQEKGKMISHKEEMH